jgi:oxygen-independent coproporphyrinogen-3 oxidase
MRRQKTRKPEDYLSKNSFAKEHDVVPFKEIVVPQDELMLEFLMNTLRLNNGVPQFIFEAYTGLSQDVLNDALKPLIKQGLIAPNDQQIKTTALGQRFLNTILTRLSP